MPRRGRSPSPSRSPSRAPSRSNVPAPAPPPPSQMMHPPQPQQPGLLKQMAATAGGVAIGSAVGHVLDTPLWEGAEVPGNLKRLLINNSPNNNNSRVRVLVQPRSKLFSSVRRTKATSVFARVSMKPLSSAASTALEVSRCSKSTHFFFSFLLNSVLSGIDGLLDFLVSRQKNYV